MPPGRAFRETRPKICSANVLWHWLRHGYFSAATATVWALNVTLHRMLPEISALLCSVTRAGVPAWEYAMFAHRPFGRREL
jgi:hypothetical protein